MASRATYGDIVLLQLVANNTDSAQFTALLAHLSDSQALPHHQGPFMHESYLGDEKGLLTGKGVIRKEV